MGRADDRFTRAVELRRRLSEQGIWFAPIRHHSPACARAVRGLIDAVSPVAVLIEGSSAHNHLVPMLMDSGTHPPVAILDIRSSADGTVSSFFPLADFSPEWVGLRAAHERGAQMEFIDLPWVDRADDESDKAAQDLASETYYAQSQALARLAEQEHCRDHDELWEHLFELRSHGESDAWSALFDDVFAWCALARFDYEPEVLVAEKSISREAHMAGRIESWRSEVSGPLVVVTGGFHTLALVEALSVRLLGADVDQAGDVIAAITDMPQKSSGWLIRYDLTRLGSLTGYGSGIRSPGFYQREWERGMDDSVIIDCLTEIARHVNDSGTSERISMAEVIEASLQAHRLAELRGHPRPGRTDLLDACTSCFISSDVETSLREAITEVFGGSKLGTIPAGATTPPIVAEARSAAEKLRFSVSDSAKHTTTLDVRRAANARRRSRFLWLMSYLGTGFATRVAGPDFVSGHELGRLWEEWDYAWTPLVEARLVGLITEGATLLEAARHRLHADDEKERSAGAVAASIAQAAIIGLGDEMSALVPILERVLERDSNLDSVISAVWRLFGLWRSREFLDVRDPDQLIALIERTAPQVAYLIDGCSRVGADQEQDVITSLIGVADLVRLMDRVGGERQTTPEEMSRAESRVRGGTDLSGESMTPTEDAASVLRAALARLRDGDASPGLRGAALGLAVASGEASDELLSSEVHAVFAPGADQAHALRFFSGVMRAAPDLFLHTPEFFDAVDQVVSSLEPLNFLDFLPDLRRALAGLRPYETAQIAERVAERTGVNSSYISASHLGVSAQEALLGARVEQELVASLERDCLVRGGSR